MYHVWTSPVLGKHHTIQLYQKGICAIATHGCVAWDLTEQNTDGLPRKSTPNLPSR